MADHRPELGDLPGRDRLRPRASPVRVAEGGLAANPSDGGRCTLAYWHHPRLDWLHYQNADWTEDYEFLRTKPFWDLLAGAGADVVLAGHNHLYSRWAPMDAELRPAANGMVQFISGAGGRSLNGFGTTNTRPSTFVTGWSGGFGHLELRLERGRYDHRFVAAPGQPAFSDTGEDVACH
jgi:acid phosphatase type 7